MDTVKLFEILEQNKDVEFVKRILNAQDYPSLPNRDGSVSTHSMAVGEAGGRYFVYPTVVYDEGEMMRLGPDTAFGRAMRMGDYIEFDDLQRALEFSKDYKKANPFIESMKPPSLWKDMNTGPGTIGNENNPSAATSGGKP